jgi:hypothetical protein
MATERLSPSDGLRRTLDPPPRTGSVTGTALDPELERRLTALEQPENQGRGFGAADWAWLALLGVIFPAALLIWGWPG